MCTNGVPPAKIHPTGHRDVIVQNFVTFSGSRIDDYCTQPYSMTMEKWRERKDVMEFLHISTRLYHDMSVCVMKIRSSVLNKFWKDHISDKNGRRGYFPPWVLAPLAIPKVTVSFAIASMDKIGGWNEEKWVGTNFVACMWICTEAVLCDGRRRDPLLDLESVLGTIVARVSWVAECSLWKHEWITETNVFLKENHILEALNYEIDVIYPTFVEVVLVYPHLLISIASS